jgi:hypothetical protein
VREEMSGAGCDLDGHRKVRLRSDFFFQSRLLSYILIIPLAQSSGRDP